MDLRSETDTGADADSVAIADDGAVFWEVSDPFSETLEAKVWLRAIDNDAKTVGSIVHGQFIYFLWADGDLVAWETDLDATDRTRLTRLSIDPPTMVPTGITPWTDRGTDFWIDRTGEWATWTESDGPGTPQEVVVWHDGAETRWPLPGYGGGSPTLTPTHDAVIYQRSETARLTVVDLASGRLRGELDDEQFYGGEVSSTGILAAPTAHAPLADNEVCVLDVRDRLD